MVILGIGDGVDAGAALVIDDELVAVEWQQHHDRKRDGRGLPWAALEHVLEEAGLRRRLVDQVAVAGRFTPPLVARRHPRLWGAPRDAFSATRDAQVFVQAMLRQSGLGALEADRARRWFESQLRGAGFKPERVVMADIHRALAEGAYRTCAEDPEPMLVVTLHPMGDGISLAVHRGQGGQLDRVWTQRGFSALHVHLLRCAAAVGMDGPQDEQLLWSLAATGEPEADLVELLDEELHAEGPRLSRRAYPLPARRDAPVYRALASVPPRHAAASLLQSLVRTVRSVVRWHLRRTRTRRLALAGSVLDNPRLAGALAELDEVEALWVPPIAGHAWLPVGAAAGVAGLAPRSLPMPGLGRQYHERQLERALAVAGLGATRPADPVEAAAAFLAAGEGIARFQGRAGFGRHGGGTRSVLVRADERAPVDRVRTALLRAPEEEPVCLYASMPGDGAIRHAQKLVEPLRCGSVAVEVDEAFARHHHGVVAHDGRVRLQRVDPEGDPLLHRVLTALHRRTGCSAVACFPLAGRRDPYVGVPGDAIRAWQRSGLPALLLGPFLVQREP